jgi:DNA-binding LytR/AlgR family response regulator
MSRLASSPSLRALVVEDEWPARNYLVELLEASGQARVVGAVATIAEAEQALDPKNGLAVDVAFVDVNIVGSGNEAGIELVRTRKNTPGAPAFVLATAHKHHALEAFDLGIVDYLVKPFTEVRVLHCLERVAGRRGPSEESAASTRVVARHGRSLVFLEQNEVLAFEASERLTFVHTLQGRFDVDLSLSNIETTIGKQLVRVHRSWLVNLRFVRELGREGNETWLFVGTGLAASGQGIVVPVARERAQALRDTLLDGATGVRRG